jgi:hypothetical protein
MDGVFGNKAKTLLKKLSALLAKKRGRNLALRSLATSMLNEQWRCQSHPPLSLWVLHPDKQDEQTAPTVGRQSRTQSLPTQTPSRHSSNTLQLNLTPDFTTFSLYSIQLTLARTIHKTGHLLLV